MHPSLSRGALSDRPGPISGIIERCYDSFLTHFCARDMTHASRIDRPKTAQCL
jgi:hypothetical protein